jgi:hypothetical protein
MVLSKLKTRVGDLNCADVDRVKLTAPADIVQDALLNFAMSNGLYQLVQEPTIF